MNKILFLTFWFCSVSDISFCSENEELINTALCTELPVCDQNPLSSEIVMDVLMAARTAVKQNADYAQALAIVLKGLEQHSDNFALQLDLAVLLGDFSECFNSPTQDQMVQKSKQVFEKLLLEVHHRPQRAQFYFYNEYCYRFKQYEQQYENGQAAIKYFQNNPTTIKFCSSGYYYQGVGAANHAKQLIQQGDYLSARLWAEKSLVAWAQHFTYQNDYYNSYVHYALALGILGYHDEMMQALQKSATLIQKDLNYIEFQEVIDFINTIKAD